jgi:hypothetical protein
MILSASEIKQQLLNDSVTEPQKNVIDFEDKRKEYAELGNAIKRMTTTKGWKILEAWLTRHIDIQALLSPDEKISERAKEMGRTVSMILGQIQFWIAMGEKAEESKEE